MKYLKLFSPKLQSELKTLNLGDLQDHEKVNQNIVYIEIGDHDPETYPIPVQRNKANIFWQDYFIQKYHLKVKINLDLRLSRFLSILHYKKEVSHLSYNMRPRFSSTSKYF